MLSMQLEMSFYILNQSSNFIRPFVYLFFGILFLKMMYPEKSGLEPTATLETEKIIFLMRQLKKFKLF